MWSRITHFHSTGRKRCSTVGSGMNSGLKPQTMHIAPTFLTSVSRLMSSRRVPSEPAMTGPLHFSQRKAARWRKCVWVSVALTRVPFQVIGGIARALTTASSLTTNGRSGIGAFPAFAFFGRTGMVLNHPANPEQNEHRSTRSESTDGPVSAISCRRELPVLSLCGPPLRPPS